MRSHGRDYAWGAYTWSHASIKEEVGLSVGGSLCAGGGLIGREIR